MNNSFLPLIPPFTTDQLIKSFVFFLLIIMIICIVLVIAFKMGIVISKDVLGAGHRKHHLGGDGEMMEDYIE